MTTLIDKLQLKDSMVGQILGQPPSLDLPISHTASGRDFAVVFVRYQSELTERSGVLPSINEDAVLWFCYPKQSGSIDTDITRDRGWQPLYDAGYRGVRQIAIDHDWSALRFRQKEFIGSRR